MKLYLSTIDLEFVVSHVLPGGVWRTVDDERQYRRPSGLLLTWHADDHEIEVHGDAEISVMLMQIKLNKAALDWRNNGFSAFQVVNENKKGRDGLLRPKP